MEKQLETGSVPGRIPFSAPEQDYITRYYAEGWYCLSIQWNYQIHQLAYCSRSGASNSVRVNMNYEKDVHMVHFSGKVKPSHWMFDTTSPSATYTEFVNTTMVDQFLTILKREKASKDKARIQEHIREVTWISCKEWYDHYDMLVTEQPWIANVVLRIRDTLVANAARPAPIPRHKKKKSCMKTARGVIRTALGQKRIGGERMRARNDKRWDKCVKKRGGDRRYIVIDE